MVPSACKLFTGIDDPRDVGRITHSLAEILLGVSKTWGTTPRVGVLGGRRVPAAPWSGISQADQPAKGKQAAPGF